MSKLLVVDDEQSICWGVKRLAESLGLAVEAAGTAEKGLARLDEFAPDVVLMDVRLPGMDGLTAVREIRQRLPETRVIVMTAFGDLETAVSAVRSGAFEYIVKPFHWEQMQRVIERALRPPAADTEAIPRPSPTAGLIGASPVMQQAFRNIALAAESDAGVLLCGESGTGKELAARAIHRFSGRHDGPFVAVNVASLSPSLAESELFGHVAGAFTGAQLAKPGLLTLADGGTLFLDEVGDVPPEIQVKLLRAIEQREILPVGGQELIASDFRVISATHRPLLELVQAEAFRHDLYFRLASFQIDLPPLRDRGDDVLLLAEHFLQQLGGVPIPTVSEAAGEELLSRVWPGNVRELRNAIEHALVVTRSGRIEPEHLPAPAGTALTASGGNADRQQQLVLALRAWVADFQESQSRLPTYEELLEVVEPPFLDLALEACQNQVATAARSLGLHRHTLKKKLENR